MFDTSLQRIRLSQGTTGSRCENGSTGEEFIRGFNKCAITIEVNPSREGTRDVPFAGPCIPMRNCLLSTSVRIAAYAFTLDVATRKVKVLLMTPVKSYGDVPSAASRRHNPLRRNPKKRHPNPRKAIVLRSLDGRRNFLNGFRIRKSKIRRNMKIRHL